MLTFNGNQMINELSDTQLHCIMTRLYKKYDKQVNLNWFYYTKPQWEPKVQNISLRYFAVHNFVRIIL